MINHYYIKKTIAYLTAVIMLSSLFSGWNSVKANSRAALKEPAAEYDGWIVKLNSAGIGMMSDCSEGDIQPEDELLVVDSLDEAQEYLESGLADYAEPNYIVTLQDITASEPNWAYTAMRGAYVEGLGLTGRNIKIAIIDSGLNRTLDLAQAHIETGYNYLNNNTDVADNDNHGTIVASMIAGGHNDGVGVDGLAPEASIVPLKCFNLNTSRISCLIDAINYAVTSGCDIINMSWGLTANSSLLREAIVNAYNAGVVLIAAAGNINTNIYPPGTLMYPAAWDEVLGVGAVDESLTVAAYSQNTAAVSLTAPGTDVYGAGNSGTSFAAPCVSAAAALILQLCPSITNSGLYSLLEERAQDLGTAGYDTAYGYGFVRLDLCLYLPYSITYYIDGAVWKIIVNIPAGTALTAAEPPVRKGYVFSGWTGLPSIMPAHDISVTGSFALGEFSLLNADITATGAALSFNKPPEEGWSVYAAAFSSGGRMLTCRFLLTGSEELELAAEGISYIRVFILKAADGYAPVREYILIE